MNVNEVNATSPVRILERCCRGGLSSGELEGMSEALGPAWTSKFRNAEELPLQLIASRLPEEEAFFEKMSALVWQMTQTMFSEKVIVPGTTRTSDLVWWWRQRVNDMGLGTWFQPSIDVQRQGAVWRDHQRYPARICRALVIIDLRQIGRS